MIGTNYIIIVQTMSFIVYDIIYDLKIRISLFWYMVL